jgi:hypothetical protein
VLKTNCLKLFPNFFFMLERILIRLQHAQPVRNENKNWPNRYTVMNCYAACFISNSDLFFCFFSRRRLHLQDECLAKSPLLAKTYRLTEKKRENTGKNVLFRVYCLLIINVARRLYKGKEDKMRNATVVNLSLLLL